MPMATSGSCSCSPSRDTLDVASRVSELGKAVPSYLGETLNFSRRSLEAPCRAGDLTADLDVEVIAGPLLGIGIAVRMLARTGAKRQALENVARPALELLRKRARRPRRKSS
jgi:hypothetical protein